MLTLLQSRVLATLVRVRSLPFVDPLQCLIVSPAVLKRDGTNVVTDSSCKATSGNWVSPYDGVATTLASDLDIDHLVPLKEAWLSGARDWTDAQREAFANMGARSLMVSPMVTTILVQRWGVPSATARQCLLTDANTSGVVEDEDIQGEISSRPRSSAHASSS